MIGEHIEFQVINDEKGGTLVAEHFPFLVKRTAILDMRIGQRRGMHANWECDQIISVIAGDVRLMLENGEGKKAYVMHGNGRAVLVPALCWRTVQCLSRRALVMLHCSKEYNADDYIRDYEEFKDAVQSTG